MLSKPLSVKGIDLHSNRFTVSHLYDGKINRQTCHVRTGMETFQKTLDKEDVIVVEASTNTFAFVRCIKDLVKEVLIVHPHSLRIIFDTHKKTDRVDADKLAKAGLYHLMVDQNHLPLVYMPEEHVVELRSLFTTYKLLQEQITSLTNRIHSILKSILIPSNELKITGKKVKEEILQMEMAETHKMQIGLLYEQLEMIESQKGKITEKILGYAGYCEEEIRIICSLTGVSLLTALALKADYADISRFANVKQFCSYLRTAPCVDSSNDTVKIGALNKRSRKLSLGFILQGLHHYVKKNEYVKSYQEKKKQGKHPGKVRIAIARKMLTALYFMLKRKELYRQVDQKIYQRKLKELEEIISQKAA